MMGESNLNELNELNIEGNKNDLSEIIMKKNISSISSSGGDMNKLRNGIPECYSDKHSPTDSISNMHDTYYLNDRIRCIEGEKLALMMDHNNLIREFNKRMESHMEEIRHLKETNQMIEREATELRDLCCFLDDDRQKCRQLAKEWQKFGRHSVSVMRTDVLSYQEKLHELEHNQTELIKENTELRDLCVYLDSQRTNTGDHENSSKYFMCTACSNLQKEDGLDIVGRSITKNYTAEQVSNLQNQVYQLESEKDMLHKLLIYGRGRSKMEKKRVSFTVPSEDDCDSSSTSEVDKLEFPPTFESAESFIRTARQSNCSSEPKPGYANISPRNKDLVRLQDNFTEEQLDGLKEKLSKSICGEACLSEHEIATLKEMCNVVQKIRSDSNTSAGSLNSSFDFLSPPPAFVTSAENDGKLLPAKNDVKSPASPIDVKGETPSRSPITKKVVEVNKEQLPSYEECAGGSSGDVTPRAILDVGSNQSESTA